MKKDIDLTIASSGQLMRRGYTLLAENVGKAVALITAVIAVLVSFTDVGFCDLRADAFTSSVLVMLVASYIIYFSMEDAGERLGREGDEYRAAEEEYNRACAEICAQKIDGLRKYCDNYRDAELEYRRGSALLSLGLSREDYDSYCRGKNVEQKRKFKRIKKMRPISLSPALLLSRKRTREQSEVKNPADFRLPKLLLGLIPSTLCTVFTLSVMLTAKSEMTAVTVLESILKLTCLPIIALRGYSCGYSYVTGSESGWLKTKTKLLRAFLATDSSQSN